MTDLQTVVVWPAEIKRFTETKPTPYRFLGAKAGVIARAAWWLLGKLGALEPYVETVETWTYLPSVQTDLLEAVLRAVRNGRGMFNIDDAAIIMGAATFQELTDSPVIRNYMIVSTAPVAMEDPYRGRRVAGIPIHVVPGMTGMAVVPRVAIEKRFNS